MVWDCLEEMKNYIKKLNQEQRQMVEIKNKINKLEIKSIGEFNWCKFRDLFVLNLQECQSEQELSKTIEVFLAYMFKDIEWINEIRKEVGLKLLTDKENKEIREFTMGKDDNNN